MPDEPALRIFPDEFVPNVEASDAFKRWARTSPGDKARWESFRNALLADSSAAAVPVMSTKFGKALIASGREHMSISQLVGQVTNPYPPPDPPSTPPPPQGTLYFSAVHETTNIFDEWTAAPNGYDGVGDNGSCTNVTAEGGVTPRRGTRMHKLYLSLANRANWDINNLQSSVVEYHGLPDIARNPMSGGDIYFGGSFYLKSPFTPGTSTGGNLVEWHAQGAMQQAPIHFGVLGTDAGANGGKWFIDVHRQATGWNPVYLNAFAPRQENQWLDFVIRTKWSSTSSGVVSLYLKPSNTTPMGEGDIKASYPGANTPELGEPNKPQICVYRTIVNQVATVYFDEIRIGNTLEIVDPARYS